MTNDAPAVLVNVAASRCPKCGSTERSRYVCVVRRPSTGMDADGQPHSHVVWRRTRCRACGQSRVDRSFELRRG